MAEVDGSHIDAAPDTLADASSDATAPPASRLVDRVVFDNDEGFEHLNIEVSPNFRWATLNRRNQTSLALHPVLFAIDERGELVPRCEWEELSVKLNSSFQVGERQGKTFAVALEERGEEFIVIRPTDTGDCASMLELVPVRGFPLGFDYRELLNPYPVRGTDSDAWWVAFHRHDSANGEETVYVVDVGTDEPGFAFEAWGDRPPGGRFGTFVSVARWAAGEDWFLSGRWTTRPLAVQAAITEVHVNGTATTRFATEDEGTKADVFPFIYRGESYFLAAVGGSSSGTLFARQDGEFRPLGSVPFDPEQTTVPSAPEGETGAAISYETFEWGDALYTSYQVSNDLDRGPGCRGPHCTSNELWVARFAEDSEGRLTGVAATCRVSAPAEGDFRGKIDPEPVVFDGGARIYYQRSDLTRRSQRPGMQLAMVDLGPQAAFDLACDEGRAAPDLAAR